MPKLSPTQDWLLRTARKLDSFATELTLLVGHRASLVMEAPVLVRYGLISKEASGVTGTWYRVTPKGCAYMAETPPVPQPPRPGRR